ncbi:unnamed protein product, partial [Heterotrigona itama]
LRLTPDKLVDSVPYKNEECDTSNKNADTSISKDKPNLRSKIALKFGRFVTHSQRFRLQKFSMMLCAAIILKDLSQKLRIILEEQSL